MEMPDGHSFVGCGLNNRIGRKALQYFKGTDAYRDLKGVHLHVLDPGGKGMRDDRGYHRGKTEPVVEMVHSSSCKIFITTAMRKTLEECYMTINDLRALWLAFLKMDRKNRLIADQMPAHGARHPYHVRVKGHRGRAGQKQGSRQAG